MGRSTTASGGQAVVDEKSQVVLAASLRQSPADCSALPGMLTELAESLTAAGIKSTHPHTAGRCQVLLRRQRRGGHRCRDRSAAGDRAAQTRRETTGGATRADPEGPDTQTADEPQATDQDGQGRRRPTQGDRGTGLRSDQRRPKQIVSCFKAVRDFVVFTDKRLIAVNVQGMTGTKRDFTSLPYSKIQAFSVETAGTFDLDAELDLWFSRLGKVRLEFKGSSDIRQLGQMIATFVL